MITLVHFLVANFTDDEDPTGVAWWVVSRFNGGKSSW